MGVLQLRSDQRQVQSLSPRLQQAVRLLQMSSIDFAAVVRGKLGENPLLEEEDGPAETVSELAGTDACVEAAAPEPEVEFAGEFGDDRDLWMADRLPSSRQAADGETSAMDTMAAEQTLAMHLHGQLNLLPLPRRDLVLARSIVESLDDDGYLRISLEELVGFAPVQPAASVDELQIALRRVQSLDPSGVGARDVAECLRLQLQAIDCPLERSLAKAIIDEHLPSLAARDVQLLAGRLGQTREMVKRVCDRIRRFDPRPGWRFGPALIRYVVPDVTVRKRRGEWVVQLNPSVMPKVRLNRVYAELFARHRRTDNAEMAGHLEDARWTLRNVEQRFATILDVASAIVRHQRHFLEFGAMAMKPLLLRDIASECGIHESTVSRVTNNKYMATPIGVFELKHFFSRAIVSAGGNACSGTAIRELIKDIITGEAANKPFSDAEICRQLATQGLRVARRTVTKYRQMLHIDAVERRRVR
ncbi:RNA polymerase factor sigma-54 [Ideonella sp. DXS29W]|uniref:RNA polymerase sigma-54 factor n=1 Tax=Ideonella lacteola TaxID=2984193 RepID=A0ABU9BHM8_9BURK